MRDWVLDWTGPELDNYPIQVYIFFLKKIFFFTFYRDVKNTFCRLILQPLALNAFGNWILKVRVLIKANNIYFSKDFTPLSSKNFIDMDFLHSFWKDIQNLASLQIKGKKTF